MDETAVVALFERFGAYRKDDHFVYASGKHGHEYLDKKTVLAEPEASGALASEMYRRWIETSDDPVPDIVAGPAVSGADLAWLVSEEYNRVLTGDTISSLSIEKDGQSGFCLAPKDREQVKGRFILLTEDILNTAGSLIGAAKAVQDAGGIIIGASVIWNRGSVTDLGFPFAALVTRQLEAYDAADCPFCKAGRPINTDLGHGAEYIRRNSQPS